MVTSTKTVAKTAAAKPAQKSILDRLTLGELSFVEELSGTKFAKLSDDGFDMKTLQAFVYVLQRRKPEHITITFEEAGNYTFDEANKILGLSDEDDA